MGAQKPLIVPWLIEQLDAQRYLGVSWLNSEKTLFRVSWKHGARHNVSKEDFQIFEDWAIARGHYEPGIHLRNPSDWKRNFRSALNRKEGIEMVKDNSTDSEDPHKVYKIQYNHIANLNHQLCEEEEMQVSDVPLIPAEGPLNQDETTEDLLNFPDCFTLDEVSYSKQEAEKFVCYGGPSSPNLHLETPIIPTPPLEQLVTSPFGSDFEVQAFYRGRLVLQEMFRNSKGLCFEPVGVHGNYPDLADVFLPNPTALCDKLQASYTQQLLSGVAPGVLLRIDGNHLYGMRKGSCHVFWSHSEMPGEGEVHGVLPKEKFSPIFSLQEFVSELIGYMEGRNGSPNYTRWLCFGEKWPDPNRSWKKKLIMVQVIPKTLQFLYDMSQSNGASSLKDGELDLRISDPLQQDCLLEQLRQWERTMEVQVRN